MKSLKLRILTLLACALFLFQPFQVLAQQQLSEKEIDQKVNTLIKKMTLQEKVGQMTLFTSDMTVTGPTIRSDYEKLIKQGKVGALFNAYGADYTRKLQKLAVENSRLGIPLLYGYDVIHGFRTVFPIPLGEAASWDPSVAQKSAGVAARESAAAGLQWTFAPMVDIARDPRWGRIAEGAGEDTYLGEKMAAARVKGFQGNSLFATNTILACAKHYAAYGAAEGGRDYNTVNMSIRRLRDVYLPPFKAAKDAGVATYMTSFNELNGVPATGNKFLMNQVLHNEWNFNGFVVTDYTSIPEMIVHGFAKDETDAAYKAVEASVDMDMQSGLFLSELPKLIKEGKVSEQQINKAVARILRLKYKLGLLQDPYRYSDATRQKQEILSDENKQAARDVARKSIVLLKNENQLLPLDKNIKNLAVIGPLADDQEDLLGPWSGAGRGEDNISVLSGIKAKVSPETNITYVKGAEITGNSEEGFEEAKEAARKADVAVVVVGEARNMSGEAASRATLDLPGVQQDLLKAVHETGTPAVMVMMNGRPLTITWSDKYIPSILETWFLGTEGGNAIADVLFGDYNPGGKLPVTFPRHVGMVPYYYNHKNTGRPKAEGKYNSKYIDVKNTALYPFGYGLSYTTFSYDNLKLSKKSMSVDDSLQVSVDVENTGNRAGDEVVQLYIRDLVGSVTRPIEQLRGFKRLHFEPGETKTVHFTLNPDDLKFHDINMDYRVEPGQFKVFVGGNSKDVLQTGFEVTQ